MIIRFTCLAAALIAVGLLAQHVPDRADAGTPYITLVNGARSPEDLVGTRTSTAT
jgi:hypothetical protein